ncbi:Carbamate kinase 1 [Paraliobacillus sp. PM-2]|uniref:carbamate kinase n=1 Tax=Paraliobacillus sp. PM-2 TaxID=1462524 RepID=UPI00061CBEB9|nr:carbamate kinase [Paraliobacillus sp. PM-2]CQR46307.1 Carbamate kinase 1 [Paraliobacillus sp. PM-2]
MNKKRILIALGGNAILQSKQEATYEVQRNNIQQSCEIIADLIEQGHEIVVTHGNGPQVGNILRQQEEAKDVVPPFPLDVCNAESQGFIGYMLEQALRNEMIKRGINKDVTTVLTESEVSSNDSAFSNPEKPIGVFYSEVEAKQLSQDKGWVMKEDSNRGYRRVVPSPKPMKIIGSQLIQELVNNEKIVIAAGGGGIPVVKQEDGTYKGIEAVIDKDRSGSQLAKEVNADVFMIVTDVDHVFVHYGTPKQKALSDVSVEEIKQYIADGEFSAGSMGPKVEAALSFAENNGHSIICSLNKAHQAINGSTGTHMGERDRHLVP